MSRNLGLVGCLAVVGAALVFGPIRAQQPAPAGRAAAPAPTAAATLAPNAPAGSPSSIATKQDPIRFRAFNVSLNAGMSGVTEIVVERWSTNAERTQLVGLVETSKEGQRGQRKLLDGLTKIKPRVGYIRTPNSIGWDLHYAVESKLADGTRQIVIATDKPVAFGAAAVNSQAMDYPFTMLEMRMKPGQKGEGRMLLAASISVKNGKLELENYGQEAIRLQDITEEQKTKK